MKGNALNRISLKSIFLVAISVLVLTACATPPRSYPEQSFPKSTFEQVKRSQDPLRLKLSVIFKRDGKHLKEVDKDLYDNAELVLRGTGAVMPTSQGEDGTIHIEVDNLVNFARGFAKGMGNGLTMGMVGTTLTDHYIINISIVNNGKKIERNGIKHQLHTVIGRGSIPDGVEFYDPQKGFNKMVEQVILNTLMDMQGTGELSVQQAPSLWSRMLVAMS